MFSYILKKMRFRQILNYSRKEETIHEQKAHRKFSQDLEKNLDTLKGIIGASSDIVIRKFAFGYKRQIQAAIIFIDGLTDKALINENIMKPLMYDIRFIYKEETSEINNISYIKSTLLSVVEVEETASINEAVDSFLSGDTLLLIDGSKETLIIHLRGWKTRGLEEPKTESAVRGPREGFTESLSTNTALLRRKIKNPDFMLEKTKLGARTKTEVCIAYIQGLANPQLIEEIRRRLKRINTDAILESGYIEQFIEDAPFSIFPTVSNSEKPDKVAAKLLEGRAAILVDGTPFVLTVPMLFIESFQTAEDYYSRPFFASIIRILRFVSYSISILAPALYVALTTFHQELIPTSLLLTMAATHEGVPFPSILEAGLMMIAFEILREAGVRLPRPVGQAVSIVGALVIGQSAVSAGLIGAPMVIVVAITAVSSFVVPPQTDSGAVIRFILLILAGFMGGFGIAMGLLAIFIHMASLRSFGTPYLSPLAPLSPSDLKDTFVRAPIWTMLKRPKDIAWHDPERQKFRLKPNPPQERKNGSKE
ncbi:spore germination protein [Desulfitobacterium metallireducens]|uniref:Spore germination protein KA n=1 Tax=Desulfitobacterium metallireducens DSM 15288 TaxID=871968 RepID=W0E6G4_9FIRM|nr:spore germination protein [Desulfitobacterium metallireducens]AHF06470.1 spore germination protein KA [Desulfitobacterium metallireducens DSM 15288]